MWSTPWIHPRGQAALGSAAGPNVTKVNIRCPLLYARIWPRTETGTIPTGQILYPPYLVIVEASAGAAEGFVLWHWSSSTRALGSPKPPRAVECGRNPGKHYVTAKPRFVSYLQSAPRFFMDENPPNTCPELLWGDQRRNSTQSNPRKSLEKIKKE